MLQSVVRYYKTCFDLVSLWIDKMVFTAYMENEKTTQLATSKAKYNLDLGKVSWLTSEPWTKIIPSTFILDFSNEKNDTLQFRGLFKL